MEGIKDILNCGCLILIEFLKQSYLVLIKLSWSPSLSSSRPCCGKSGLRSLANKVSFKLCQCSKHMENELPAGGCGINAFGDAAEAHAKMYW